MREKKSGKASKGRGVPEKQRTGAVALRIKKERELFFAAFGISAVAAGIFCIFYAAAIDRGMLTDYKRILALFFVLLLFFVFLYLYEKYVSKLVREKLKSYYISLTATVATLVICVLLLKYVNIDGSEFFLPLALLFLLTAALLDVRTAAYAFFIGAFGLFFIILDSAEIFNEDAGLYGVLFNMIGGAALIFTVNKNYRRINIILYGAAIGAVISLAATVYAFLSGEFSMFGPLWLMLSVVSSSALFFFLLPILERTFDVATDFRISEYLTPKNPLLKELKEKAPGTFHHAMSVATLAESCAEAIGENPLLARAAAYYHDIGKTKAPEFFSENQTDGYNPHDELIPEVSASKITAHTVDGVEILRANRFPEEIVRAAEEHHGNSPVSFFYNKAQNMTEGGGLGTVNYVYDNHRPSTKISAVIMICDTVESAVRSSPGDNLKGFIHKLIKDKLDLGQFSECDISMKDLERIEATILETIPKMFHSRIRYNTPAEAPKN